MPTCASVTAPEGMGRASSESIMCMCATCSHNVDGTQRRYHGKAGRLSGASSVPQFVPGNFEP